jgi:hypothetical protein
MDELTLDNFIITYVHIMSMIVTSNEDAPCGFEAYVAGSNTSIMLTSLFSSIYTSKVRIKTASVV